MRKLKKSDVDKSNNLMLTRLTPVATLSLTSESSLVCCVSDCCFCQL